MYLSWSIPTAVVVALIVLTVMYLVNNAIFSYVNHEDTELTKREIGRIYYLRNIAFIIIICSYLAGAVGFGDTKAQQYRTNYDTNFEEIVVEEKKEVVVPTAESVYNDFQSKINNQKEN